MFCFNKGLDMISWFHKNEVVVALCYGVDWLCKLIIDLEDMELELMAMYCENKSSIKPFSMTTPRTRQEVKL